MSTLTKIFSIAFTMTTINFVANTSSWKELAEEYQQELQVVETHMRSLSAAHAAEKTAWLDARQEKDALIAKIRPSNPDRDPKVILARELPITAILSGRFFQPPF